MNAESMTAPLLLAYIGAAFVAQLAVVIGVVAWRRHHAAAETSPATAGAGPPTSMGAWPGWRDFRVSHREFEDSSNTQCSFYIEPVDGVPLPPFKPGQFLTFSLQVSAGAQDGERAITRCYSLSDSPDPARYRVTIKRVPAPAGRPDLPPGASSTYFHDKVHVGDVLKVRAPAGHFFIDPDPNIPAVLIAGGIGVTPMMSMLRWSLAEQPERTVRLYYGLRHSGEHAFKAILEQLAAAHPNLHLNVVYSRPLPGDVQGRDFQYTGHVDLDLLRLTLPHGRHKFYICGPAPMMESLLPALSDWGAPGEDIHHEAFGPDFVRSKQGAPKDTVSRSAPIEVKFHRSGRTVAWDGQDTNLLDFAERHGIAVESGCRSGSCGSCETKVLSGSVRYAGKPDYDIAAGHCLLCVGAPEAALSIEA
jgi:uncharacterized protein